MLRTRASLLASLSVIRAAAASADMFAAASSLACLRLWKYSTYCQLGLLLALACCPVARRFSFSRDEISYASSAAVMLAFLRYEELVNRRRPSTWEPVRTATRLSTTAARHPRPTERTWRTAARPAWRVLIARITLIATARKRMNGGEEGVENYLKFPKEKPGTGYGCGIKLTGGSRESGRTF